MQHVRQRVYDMMDAMGNLATEAEAEAMCDIIDERKIIERDLTVDQFISLIPEAIARTGGNV